MPGGAAARAESDSSAGRKIFKQCRNCHSVRQGKTGTFGPNLYQVVGRIAGMAAASTPDTFGDALKPPSPLVAPAVMPPTMSSKSSAS